MIVAVVLSLIALIAAPATGTVYTGSLSSGAGELQGSGVWVQDDGSQNWTPAMLSWTVHSNPNNTWHYSYTLSVTAGGVSHLILETSDSFDDSDLLNAVALSGSFGSTEIKTHTTGSGNPLMPSDIYGIKFDDATGTTLTIEFDSPRVPVWGDFYAKDGTVGGVQNAVWNGNGILGFTNPDSDPIAPPADGSVDLHVLVPDTVEIPEPGTLAVLLGGAGLMMLRRRRD